MERLEMNLETGELSVVPLTYDERQVFLTNLLNDYLTFDDAVYPRRYDRTLEPDEDGYIAPIIRTEWNAASAAAWGFEDQAAIETMLAEPPPPPPEPVHDLAMLEPGAVITSEGDV
jgi:hypothetical protein